MPSTIKRLAVLGSAAVLAVITSVVMTGSSSAMGAANRVDATALANPVGVWKGTVQHPGGGGNITVNFVAGGTACLTSADGTGAGGSGSGTWTATGATTWTYQAKERLFDANGKTTGFVDVNQNAGFVANTGFTSSGQSDFYDANGNRLGTGEAKVSATRVAGTPCC